MSLINCKVCKIDKKISDYYAYEPARCKKCIINRNETYYKNNPGKRDLINLRVQLKVYGLSIEDFEKLKEKQSNVCAICKKPEIRINNISNKTQRLTVDHCHKTGKVRGLLCHKCNKVLGLVYDDIEICKNIIAYLDNND